MDRSELRTIKKRLPTILLVIVLLACLFPFSAPAANAAGVAIRLALEPDAGEAEQAAAAVLQDYLEKITGTRPSLTAADIQGQMIALRLNRDEQGQKKGAYTLRGDGAAFTIEAVDERGLWNGVYGFLRRVCGVEVYAADVISVPENGSFTLPDTYEYTYEPLLEYADTDWASGNDLTFAVANGLNGSRSGLDKPYGKPVNYLGFCHTLGADFVPYWVYFDAHPEYYALTERSGRREPTQVCLSNPDVLQLTIEGVLNKLNESYDPEAALNIVSVSQLDNFDYCVCENCAALAEQYGGPSGALIWFINQMAEAVEPEYPDAVIDTFAYEYTRHAPKNITVWENVCVRLCSIECCYAHAIDDPACAVNAEFYQDLQDWSAICRRLYVWDYTTDFNQTLGVFPNFGVLRENLRAFRENNVVGYYAQGVGPQIDCDTEFADLRAYELACNMREDLTEEENAALRRGFLNAYYGEGADEIEQYLAYITEHAGDRDGHLYNRASMLKVLHNVTKSDVKTVDALWETAVGKCEAAGNTAAADRVLRSQLSWRYYKACNGLGEFHHGLNVSRWTKANQLLFDDLVRSGNTSYDEGKPMPEKINPLLYPLAWVDAEGMVLTIDTYLIPAIAALALVITIVALIKKKYWLLLANIAALCGIFATTWLVDFQQLGLVTESSVLLALIAGTLIPLIIYGYSRKKGVTAKKGVAGAVAACVLTGAFIAVLIVLDKNMLNGLNSHLAYFTVCLVLEGVALLGLLILLPCAFLKRKKCEEGESA
ncbi:MAG: DUF4838 domain-containing protein [Clostridia bacterium]|nr:DUF4838 domain-containing protein [Clostridia bacterium]